MKLNIYPGDLPFCGAWSVSLKSGRPIKGSMRLFEPRNVL